MCEKQAIAVEIYHRQTKMYLTGDWAAFLAFQTYYLVYVLGLESSILPSQFGSCFHSENTFHVLALWSWANLVLYLHAPTASSETKLIALEAHWPPG